jgi:hypothetical protein
LWCGLRGSCQQLNVLPSNISSCQLYIRAVLVDAMMLVAWGVTMTVPVGMGVCCIDTSCILCPAAAVML